MKKSKSGTKNTGTFSLSADDLCRILSLGKLSSVDEIVLPGIKIKFHPQSQGDAEKLGQASDQKTLVSTKNEEIEKVDIKETQSTSCELQDFVPLMDSEALLEAQEAQLLIDDPLAFEKSQIDRHIERVRGLNGEEEV